MYRNLLAAVTSSRYAYVIAEGKNAMGDRYTELARQSFTHFVNTGSRMLCPDNLDENLLTRQAACFVSLHKNGDLRGCIGTLVPTQPSLAEEIIENAISACSRDPRFPAIELTELEDIHCSVDVLSEAEDINNEGLLDVKRYGVIVQKGFRRGVLLPDLEGVDTVEDQIRIAKAKAGIFDNESVQLQRFEVVRHSE